MNFHLHAAFYLSPTRPRLTPSPHWYVFILKRIHFEALRPSVHTNTLSDFVETHRFQNALKVMLHETIRNNNFWCKTALQYWYVIVLKSYNIVPTMIETICCAKSRRCESYPVTSLKSGSKRKYIHIIYTQDIRWMIENGLRRIKIKTMIKNIAGACA